MSATFGIDCSHDYTNEFTTHQVFESKVALLQWIRIKGKKNNCVIVIERSDSANWGNKKRRPKIRFCCERSGKYREFKRKIKMGVKNNLKPQVDIDKSNEKRPRLTATKKCQCPFKLKAFNIGADEWILEVACGVHNHVAPSYLEGHSYAGRLTTEEQHLLVNMSKNLMRPKDILTTIKSRDPSNTSTLRTIYNARHAARVRDRAGRTQMQQLLKNLHDHQYIEHHRSADHVVTDLFWCHPFSLQILRTFPHVLIMDCTYKTNRYRFPLFEIVGITCIEKTFNVAYVYMSKESEDNYTWALSRLKILVGNDSMPEVIVTDRELALMKAVEQVFPETHQVLCKWHISKNVLKKCKASFATAAGWEMFIQDWNSLVDSNTEDDYLRSLAAFESKYIAYSKDINYLKTTWLNKYKEMFVAAWTNKYMHLGARTSNRAESAHAKLKRELKSSQLDFSVSWEHIHSLLCLHHIEIKASFEKSRCYVQHDFRHAYLRDLIGFVSISALNKIVCEANSSDNLGQELALCNCAIRKTHGLPCAHELAEHKRSDRSIPISSVHRHWRMLEIMTTKEDLEIPEKVHVKTHLDRLAEWAEVQDEETKRQILVKIDELMNPSSTLLREPAEKTKTKGRPSKIDTSTRRFPSGFEIVEALLAECDHSSPVPSTRKITSALHAKKSNDQVDKTKPNKPTSKDPRFEITQKYTMQFIFGMRPYITGSMDVEDDGNCGFRVVAAAMGFGRKHWRKVRTDLMNELKGMPDLYEGLFGGQSTVEQLHHRSTILHPV